jgi:KipI family sensor histidine kinase inhibitor
MDDDTRYPEILPVGEDSVLVQYEPEVSREVNKRVISLTNGLRQLKEPAIREIVPAYRSLMIYFDPFSLELSRLLAIVDDTLSNLDHISLPQPRLFSLPTVYGGEFGPDLESISQKTGLSASEIIRIFSETIYPVYCLGFMCGLAYMGGVPEKIQVPRLDSPRPKMPAGSVGFAGPQANVLPITTPSGFNYIGRTFVTLYDPQKSPPTMIQAGDYIQCPAVSEDVARRAGETGIEDCVEIHQDH